MAIHKQAELGMRIGYFSRSGSAGSIQVAEAAPNTTASVMLMMGSACPPLAIAGAVLSILGSMFHDDPEPLGDTQFTVDASGQLAPQLITDQDSGGDPAMQAAQGVANALTQMRQASNAAFAAQGHDVRIHARGLIAPRPKSPSNTRWHIASNHRVYLVAA